MNTFFGGFGAGKWLNIIGAFLLIWPILFVYFFHETCYTFQCSLETSLFFNFKRTMRMSLNHMLNTNNLNFKTPLFWFAFWVGLQIILYKIIPGKITHGPVTTSGKVYPYKINGTLCFVISNIFMLTLARLNILSKTLFFDHLFELLFISNLSGIILSIFVFMKGFLFPNEPKDCKFSGSYFYDLYMGIEHSPRLFGVDFKQFFNARTGIAAWSLINLSFAFKQIELYGNVSNSMVALNILQFFYIFDLFWNEDWYVKTIDMAYDHFGFYLAWGDLVWLPFMYTLQGLYLVYHPIHMNNLYFLLIIFCGASSYTIFRISNSQRIEFRKKMEIKETCYIFGRPATFIRAYYKTSDGTEVESYLLTSGFWGMARHFNYLPDILNALLYGLCCGLNHALPFFYFFFMIILLLHRVHRDQQKCKIKYGKYWDDYCKLVPYRLIPWVF